MPLALNKERLLKAVTEFSQAKILVLGDIMLDRFIWGSVSRISPEAPVPVVDVQRETALLGGAANVMHNLIALGSQAEICGAVGQDDAGRWVLELLAQLGVNSGGLLRIAERITTIKTRVVAHGQQIVRVDRENRRELLQDQQEYLRAYLEDNLARVDAVIVSDYAKGVISSHILAPLMAAAAAGRKIVCVDPKVVNINLYAGATVITPNHQEAADAAQVSLDSPDYVREAGQTLLKQLSAHAVLITQGEKGMTLFEKEEVTHIPTMAKQVYDVTGAGDTVISTLTLGLVAGLSLAEAAFVANCAAGLVVGEVGTSVVDLDYLKEVLADYSHDV